MTPLCLSAARVPRRVASSIAGLLPRAAVDRERSFAGVAAVCFSHTLFVQKAHLQAEHRGIIRKPAGKRNDC